MIVEENKVIRVFVIVYTIFMNPYWLEHSFTSFVLYHRLNNIKGLMEIFFFKDLLIIFALSIAVLLIGHRLRIPPVVGFLITGVLAGPYGFKFVQGSEDIENLAEIGIILLLFGIGMEFSVKKLVEIKRFLLIGGFFQVALTALSGFIIGYFFGRSWQESLFFGMLLSMSSTAIVLRLLEQKGESASPQGRSAISILIFQDMIAIPMILLTPMLGSGSNEGVNGWLLAKGIVVLMVVFFAAEKIVPKLLLLVARTRCRELFLLSVLTLCFGVALLTASLGLSLTIGAFLAGMIISESEYSNEAIGDIFPFQALFISFFFVSIGMLLDINFVLQQPLTILFLAFGIILLKALCAGVATAFLGMPLRTAVIVGVALSQIGEFSFVLAKTGVPFHLVTDHEYQLFLAVSLLTMAVSPLLINYSSQIASLIGLLPISERFKTGIASQNKENKTALDNHIIIVGFGVSGRHLARSSKVAGIPYVILEMNPDTVRDQRRLGEPIHFGDGGHPSVLEHMQIKQAKVVAVVVNDPIAAKRIVKMAREANPSVYIIVRTRYVQETLLMNKLGADESIPDEFGTSVEIFSRVLNQYHIPLNDIRTFIDELRSDGYDLLRDQHKSSTKLSDLKLNLSNVEVSSFRLHPGSELVGRSLAESQLRQSYGMSVLLIKRSSGEISNPSPETQLMSNDIVVVVGAKIPIAKAEILFNSAAYV